MTTVEAAGETTQSARAAAVHDLLVVEMRREAQGVVSLLLESPDGAALPAGQPGAHIDLEFENGVERQYSLCPDPTDASGWRVLVLLEEISRGGSRHVHDVLRVGDRVRARGPVDTFRLEAGDPTILIAGGIGITPILPMAVALEAQGRPWRMIYLGRSADRMALTRHPLLVDARTTIVRSDETGRADLGDLLGEVTPTTRIHACGPARLLDELVDRSTSWPPGVLRIERFHAVVSDAPVSPDAFEVVAAKSGVSVTVDPGCSILEMLEAAGIARPSSCLEGICGTCETTVLEGVPQHRDSILTPDERASGDTMMICVSRAATPRLVLDA